MIRTLIVDDERLARQRLRRLLGAHPEVEIVGESADGAAAVRAVEELRPDLLLLDIQMPVMDGFGVVEALGTNAAPLIIFVTAFDEHALRAFEACALDYLLKPVSSERLGKSIARVVGQLATLHAAPAASAEVAEPMPARFQVRSGQRTAFVAPDEIDWIEADGNYAILHVGARNHLLRATMAALEADLPATFARLSRSSIVNLRRVQELQSLGSNAVAILMDGTRLPVTGSVRELQQRLRTL